MYKKNLNFKHIILKNVIGSSSGVGVLTWYVGVHGVISVEFKRWGGQNNDISIDN